MSVRRDIWLAIKRWNRNDVIHLHMHAFALQLKQETSSILQPDVAKAMFQNIEVIHQFHHDNLLPELRERLDNWWVYHHSDHNNGILPSIDFLWLWCLRGLAMCCATILINVHQITQKYNLTPVTLLTFTAIKALLYGRMTFRDVRIQHCYYSSKTFLCAVNRTQKPK